ncbi:MAG: GlsB/YeaQ/YmgE family stress response membrane protein [Parachlamydiaceae bacterium]|nr:GlsB/YeaQ/YmgE family stress response membrane protein [Parachlamydiaceae bacterium]
MTIIWTIIIGFIVGLIARAIMPGKDIMGFIMTTLLGIGGALIARFIGQGLGFYHEGEPAGFFMSIFGAIILLLLYQLFRKKDVTQ